MATKLEYKGYCGIATEEDDRIVIKLTNIEDLITTTCTFEDNIIKKFEDLVEDYDKSRRFKELKKLAERSCELTVGLNGNILGLIFSKQDYEASDISFLEIVHPLLAELDEEVNQALSDLIAMCIRKLEDQHAF